MRLGLSQGEFAALLDISSNSISNWETGHSRPNAEMRAKLMAARQLGRRDVKRVLKEKADAATSATTPPSKPGKPVAAAKVISDFAKGNDKLIIKAGAYAGKVLDTMKNASAHVPVTWGLEVANVIARAEARGLVTEARSEAFLEMLEGVEIKVDAATFAHALSGTLQLARRYKLSAYDASYLELALRRGIPLATLDADLQNAARKAGVKKFG